MFEDSAVGISKAKSNNLNSQDGVDESLLTQLEEQVDQQMMAQV